MQKIKHRKILIFLLFLFLIILFKKYISLMNNYNNRLLTDYQYFVEYAKAHDEKITQENYKLFLQNK